MKTLRRPALAALWILAAALLYSAQAQTPRVSTINVKAEPDRVHISTEGDVTEIRLEVANESGDIVFESGAITGNELDWNMRGAQGERVAPGTYLITITFRKADGKLRKRVEQVTVAEDEASTAQATAAAPSATPTPITGTGTSGKIAKFTGASTIGNSVITESAAKIGIGTAAPTSTLTVAGMIQTTGAATGGIKFPDNTIQKTAATGDITSVVAGSGLSGGATTGAATLSIATSGVGNTQLATNAVTATKIATGQVVKSINSLKDNVTLMAGTNITITPTGNTLKIASTGGGGLTSVAHNATLTGAGTAAMPLGVAVPLNLSASNSATPVILATNKGIGVKGTSSDEFDGTNIELAGVTGTSTGLNGTGVFGGAGSGTGSAGVFGLSQDGFGVAGTSGSGAGVGGGSTDGIGVYGQSSALLQDQIAGVYGTNDMGGYAGYFDGPVKVAGQLTVTSCMGCSSPSDRNLKANFSSVNSRFILDRLASVPIQTWNYKSEPTGVRHIGPMAQDFSAAFNFGATDRIINTVDADGVALAAIQALYQMVQEKDRHIEQQSQQIAELQSRVMQLERTKKQPRARAHRQRKALVK